MDRVARWPWGRSRDSNPEPLRYKRSMLPLHFPDSDKIFRLASPASTSGGVGQPADEQHHNEAHQERYLNSQGPTKGGSEEVSKVIHAGFTPWLST